MATDANIDERKLDKKLILSSSAFEIFNRALSKTVPGERSKIPFQFVPSIAVTRLP